MARKTKKRDALTVATELEGVRTKMNDWKLVETKLRKELLDALHAEGMSEAGNYQISVSRSLKVKDNDLAIPWASQHDCLKVDTTKAREILRHTFDSPEKYGFAVSEMERIIPKGGKEEE